MDELNNLINYIRIKFGVDEKTFVILQVDVTHYLLVCFPLFLKNKIEIKCKIIPLFTL